ncbi:MAG: FtsX-like permease family protein [Hydrogeniiclostridium mannosilyticum]
MVSALSIVILMLILLLRIRGRIHEAGIYLSMGRPKAEIIGQFTLEAWVLLFAGFGLAFLLWSFCSDMVNGFLFGTLAQGTGTVALQTGGNALNCNRICVALYHLPENYLLFIDCIGDQRYDSSPGKKVLTE